MLTDILPEPKGPAMPSSTSPAPRASHSNYTTAELTAAITDFFRGNDPRRFVAMLPDDFALKIPATLPYGGTYTGPAEVGAFLARIYEGDYWESFVTDLDQVIVADGYLIAPITITARGKNGTSVTAENLWLFEIRDGHFARAQIYADTAAARPAAV
jgi:hypothetical protein